MMTKKYTMGLGLRNILRTDVLGWVTISFVGRTFLLDRVTSPRITV